jgi:MFS family permease
MQTLRRYFSLPPGLSPQLRQNIIRYFWDIAWWGVYMGSIVSFLNIYAARYGATTQQIGLLTALPAFVSLLISLPVGWQLRRISPAKATVWSAYISRLLFVLFALLPWLFPPEQQVNALLALSVIIAIPTTVINISFSQFFIQAVPPEQRGMVVGARMAIMAVVTFPVTLFCGQLLTWLPFPIGYQVVFFIGFVGALLTARELSFIRPLPELELAASQPSPTLPRRFLPALDDHARRYLKVIGLLFLFNFTNSMFAPIVPIWLVERLKLTDAVISYGTATANILMFVVSLRIARILHRTGNRKATALGAVLLAVASLALAFAQDAGLYIVSAIIGGIASGILASAQYNYHLDNLPAHEQSSWLSWNLLLANAALLLGALTGPVIAGWLDAGPTLIVFSALRLVFGIFIWVWG